MPREPLGPPCGPPPAGRGPGDRPRGTGARGWSPLPPPGPNPAPRPWRGRRLLVASGAAAALAVLLLLVLALSGAHPSEQVVGRWVGTCSDSPRRIAEGPTFTTQFRPDGTFRVQNTGSGDVEVGRYTVVEDTITMTTRPGDVQSGRLAVSDAHLDLIELRSGPDRNPDYLWCAMERSSS